MYACCASSFALLLLRPSQRHEITEPTWKWSNGFKGRIPSVHRLGPTNLPSGRSHTNTYNHISARAASRTRACNSLRLKMELICTWPAGVPNLGKSHVESRKTSDIAAGNAACDGGNPHWLHLDPLPSRA
ncbi:hypothetical protein K431DRAFT_71812 [Polychaeton citri CBS 116435]|uniref:Secreted protein n=1 Tax=Polychaeton citri CBS 116435 TaxID=1314669 RepID=A0A9P4UMQ4_9PEZI|nr:hypothetical protein K431DRAFT_71812 [Polychaeton citri CBS 116435]